MISGESTIRIGHWEAFLKESSLRILSKCLEDVSDGVYCYLIWMSFTRVLIGSAETAQKMKFSINNFISKCDQIRKNLRIWSHLLKTFLMENFIFCAVWKSQENFQVESRFYKKIVCSYARNVLSQKKQCLKLAAETLGRNVYLFQNNIKNIKTTLPDY